MRLKKLSFVISLEAVLFVLCAVSAVMIFVSSGEPVADIIYHTALRPFLERFGWQNAIVFNLSIGVIGGVFLWWLVSWLPERRKRNLIRDSLASRYKEFKEDTIAVLLATSGHGYDSQLTTKLLDHNEFKQFFSGKRWNDATNGFQFEPGNLNDLITELELFAAEILYVLNNVDIQDAEVYSFFKRLSRIIHRFRGPIDLNRDELKPLMRFLWEIFARWDYVTGQRETDIVEDMIRRI
jgi:hypothetical protein